MTRTDLGLVERNTHAMFQVVVRPLIKKMCKTLPKRLIQKLAQWLYLNSLNYLTARIVIPKKNPSPSSPFMEQLGGVYMRKLAPARVSHWDDFLISYRVYMMTGSLHILLFNGTFHVDKIHVWFKIANITHALPVPVYRQTDFTPKWVVVSRLHDTVARFRTGVKFSPRCENRGELTPGWLAPA